MTSEKQGTFLTKIKLLPLSVVPASHILMCHREQTGTKTKTKGGRKKKKEALLIKKLVVHSNDLQKYPLLHLSNRMISNNVQQKHCRKLFILKQTKKILHFKAKLQCTAFYGKTQITM